MEPADKTEREERERSEGEGKLPGAKAGQGERSQGKKREARNRIATISGGNDERVPPVPIPNTAVKPLSADGTWLDTARESRSPPDSNKGKSLDFLFFRVFDRENGVWYHIRNS